MSQEKMDMGASPMPLESETRPSVDGSEAVHEEPFVDTLRRLEEASARAIENPFRLLTPEACQLILCALAGNHPPQFAHLRFPMLRALAQARREAKEASHGR